MIPLGWESISNCRKGKMANTLPTKYYHFTDLIMKFQQYTHVTYI